MWGRVCLLVVITACFSPSPPTGAPCPDGSCPGGQRCIANICTVGDLGPDPDAPQVRPDGATDPDSIVPPNTWTIVSTDDTSNIGGPSVMTLNRPTSGDGNLIIVAIETDDIPVTSVVDNAGNTFVPIASSRANNATELFGIEMWFANGSNAGATTITATSTSEIYAVVMWEVAGLAKTNPVDAVATVDDQPAAGLPFGAPITTTSDGAFVISVLIVATTVSGLVGGSEFTNDHTSLGNGWAHLTATNAPAGIYSARWDQTGNGVSCASSVAFRVD